MEIFYRDVALRFAAEILPRDLLHRSCSEILLRDWTEISYRDHVLRHCIEICWDLAKGGPWHKTCHETSYRYFVHGSCQDTSTEILYRDLVQRAGVLLRDPVIEILYRQSPLEDAEISCTQILPGDLLWRSCTETWWESRGLAKRSIIDSLNIPGIPPRVSSTKS